MLGEGSLLLSFSGALGLFPGGLEMKLTFVEVFLNFH